MLNRGEGRLGESLEPVIEPGDVVGDGSQPGGRVTVIAIRVRREVRRTNVAQELDELVSRDDFVTGTVECYLDGFELSLGVAAHVIEERLEVIGFADDLVGAPDGTLFGRINRYVCLPEQFQQATEGFRCIIGERDAA